MKNKPMSLPGADEMASAFASSATELWKTLSGMQLPLPPLAQLQTDYLKQATELWNDSLHRLPGAPAGSPPPAPALNDRRFADRKSVV